MGDSRSWSIQLQNNIQVLILGWQDKQKLAMELNPVVLILMVIMSVKTIDARKNGNDDSERCEYVLLPNLLIEDSILDKLAVNNALPTGM